MNVHIIMTVAQQIAKFNLNFVNTTLRATKVSHYMVETVYFYCNQYFIKVLYNFSHRNLHM